MDLTHRILRIASFPSPALHGLNSNTDLPPPRSAQPAPHEVLVNGHVPSLAGLPVLRRFPLYIHAIAITPAGPLGILRSPPQQRRPSPNFRRVGFRITLFEACSAFTARYGLHTRQVTMMTFYTRGFDCFVSSAATPIATGWSDSCRVGISPTEEPRLFTAH